MWFLCITLHYVVFFYEKIKNSTGKKERNRIEYSNSNNYYNRKTAMHL